MDTFINVRKISTIVSCLSLLITVPAFSEVGLRLKCSGDSDGAKVYINGKKSGECPITVFVPAGDISIKAVKTVDPDRERSFEMDIYLPDDSVKNIDVKLSAPKLTLAAQQRQAKEKADREKVTATAALQAAREGDIKAMVTVSNFYDSGTGFPQNFEQAKYWHDKSVETKNINAANKIIKSAESGDASSMLKAADIYTTGFGVKKNTQTAQSWLAKYFESTLQSAESGNTAAMKEVSTLYFNGKGVEKNEAYAQQWEENLALSLNHEDEKRKADARRAELEEELNKLTPSDGIREFHNATPIESAMDSRNIFSITTVSPTMTTVLLGMGSSYPTYLSKKKKLEKEIAEIAAKWDNPESMISKSLKKTSKASETSSSSAQPASE